jgi:Tfp pilus assembly protein PilN
MINLLPLESQSQLRAARANTLLMRYNVFLIGAFVFIGLALGFVYFYLETVKTSAEQTISENNARVNTYATVQAEADAFRSSLSTAKDIFDKEITYTKAVLNISRLLPAGTALQTLSLNDKTFGTQTTFAIQAKDYNAALALKDSFQSSALFSNVHFESITSSSGGGAYPITVNLNLTMSKDAAK